MTTIKIDGNTARDIATALKDCIDTRYANGRLDGIRIEYAGNVPEVGFTMIAIATDGAKLGKFDFVLDTSQDGSEMENFKPFTLPSAAVDILAKVKTFEVVTLVIVDNKLDVTVGGTTSVFTLEDTTFPDWRSVYPKEKPEMIVGFDAKQLEFIGNAVKKLGDKTIQACKFNIIDATSPCVIETPHKHLTYLLMPTNVK